MSERGRSKRNPAQRGRALPPVQPRQLTVAVLALVLGGVAAWVFWPDPAPRQREYLDATACLLTDADGVAGKEAAPVWSAMRDASESSLVRVQYLQVDDPRPTGSGPVDAPQQPGNQPAGGAQVGAQRPADAARGYVASLAGRGCGVVIAVGPAQIDAVTATAQAFPAVRFVTVGGGTPAANVAVVGDEGSGLATAIGKQVSALADAGS